MGTYPVVGLLTALAMVHTLDSVTRFNRARQVAAYCILDPREHSSSDIRCYGHISKQGNRRLRYLLAEAAHNAVRREEELRGFYRRLLARRNSALAIVAVARKLALRLYPVLRDGIDYDEFRRQGRGVWRVRRVPNAVLGRG